MRIAALISGSGTTLQNLIDRGFDVVGVVASRPGIAGIARAENAGIPVVSKTLIFSSDDHPEICGDLEGMILFDTETLLLSNDSDFGIEGAQTQFWLVPIEQQSRTTG